MYAYVIYIWAYLSLRTWLLIVPSGERSRVLKGNGWFYHWDSQLCKPSLGHPVGPKIKEVFRLRRSHDGTKKHGSSLKNCPLPNAGAIKTNKMWPRAQSNTCGEIMCMGCDENDILSLVFPSKSWSPVYFLRKTSEKNLAEVDSLLKTVKPSAKGQAAVWAW